MHMASTPYAPRPRRPSSKEPWQSGVRDAGPYLGLGAQIVTAMLVFGGGGVALDLWLGTAPWFILLGMVLAFAAIAGLLYRVNAEAQRSDDSGRVKRGNDDAGEAG